MFSIHRSAAGTYCDSSTSVVYGAIYEMGIIYSIIFEQVWFRSCINHHNPEGSFWEEVSVPGEVVQISCGPGDLVWAVQWEGHLLVREGIGRDCLHGECSSCDFYFYFYLY